MWDRLPSSLSTPVVVALIAALAALALFWGVALVFSRMFDPARRRLAEIGSIEGGLSPATLAQRVADAVRPLERFVLPQGTARETSQEQLRYAGYRSSSALSIFYVAKLTAATIAAVTWLVAAYLFLPNITAGRVAFIGLAAAYVGLIAPGVWLDAKVKTRHKLLRNGFPDALDLLTVCVESGLGLAQALQRVAVEIEISHPELATEIGQVTAQMRAGVEREAALRGLATRTGLDDVRGLVSLLVQTLRFGTGIADALRVYSEEFRDRRMQKAEEVAAKLGTKLIFPLVCCLFPSFFVVAIGPAIIKLIEAFSHVPSH